MKTLCLMIIVAAAITLTLPAIAIAADQRPGELIVGYKGDVQPTARQAVRKASGVTFAEGIGPHASVVSTKPGESIDDAAARLRKDPRVRYAVPNYVAHASADWIPNDPGRGGASGWTDVQWNFVGPFSVNAPAAWGLLRGTSGDGGKGVTVAVIDTGVAYEKRGRYRRSPDLAGIKIRAPWDFIRHTSHATDYQGHGTHVASTIVERANNGVGVTGLAYKATLMPLRALDSYGAGGADDIAKAIRYAAKRNADVINLSLEFDPRLSASDVPSVISAMRYAKRKGSLVVGAAGNYAVGRVSYPARSSDAIAVGAITRRGCLADYSSVGTGLDVVAPGGGADTPRIDNTEGSSDLVNCNIAGAPTTIYQMTYRNSYSDFGLPGGYEGTSMAAPHVSATAALVIASGVIGKNPTPDQVVERLETTARDLGTPGPDIRYGFGLIDAAAAVTPPVPPPATP